MPNMSLAGKVRRRACGPHTSAPFNARMRGKTCLKAWVSLVPERVGLKVRPDPHKSRSSSSDEGGWKRGRKVRNPRGFSPGSFQCIAMIHDETEKQNRILQKPCDALHSRTPFGIIRLSSRGMQIFRLSLCSYIGFFVCEHVWYDRPVEQQ